MEQEIQTLENARGNGLECEEQYEEIQISEPTMTDKAVTCNPITENTVEQSKFDQNANSMNPFSTNSNGEEQVEDKRYIKNCFNMTKLYVYSSVLARFYF